jgi:hypothetical protein
MEYGHFKEENFSKRHIGLKNLVMERWISSLMMLCLKI